MNTRNSIYDQLNSGRQRRSGSSLEDLEATIGGIEARLDRIRAKPASQPHSYSDEIADRMRMLSNQVAGMGGQSQPTQQPRNPRQSPRAQEGLARDIERMRRDETDQTQMNAIFAELQSLRGDMKRLTAPSQQDDWGLALGREIESLKQGIGALAREDTLRSVENRWSEHAQPTRTSLQDDPIIETLIDRIDNIQSAINGLPQSLSITSLEEKVRILASAIDQMSRRSPEFNPEHLLQIEDRLDEISRAIVASSVSVQAVNQDKAGFDRIEARLGSLNARLDEIGNAEPAQDLQDRIANLANQMDRLAEKAGAPTDQMVRMASQMETIAEKLNQLDSRNTDVDSVTHSLEERLFDIVNRLELSQVENGRENRSLFSELEGRLEDLAARMLAPAPDNSAHILEAVEQRIAHLSHQINQSQSDNVIDPVFAKNVESRLAEITNRLNQSASAIPSTDTDAMARLEEQVMNLSHKLSSQAVPSAGNDELGLRLDSIERKLASNHESLLTAARQAAEEALRHASSGNMSSDHADAVSLLANDLKSLDILARKSDDRNAKTFEAIHDTLLKIVDRLGSLEDRKPAFAASPVEQKPVRVTIPVQEEDFEPVFAPQHVAPKIDLGASAPMLDIPDAENALETHEDFSPVPVRSPAEAAMAAANAAREMAVAIEAKDGIAKPAGGLFSGLTNALRRKGKTEISADILPGTLPAKIEAPLIVGPLAGSEPVVANEANPGAPDLNAIMKRVRDERRGRTDGGSDASAKNDFLAAARRAAQAAAADAEILKNKNAKAAKTGKSGLADIVQRQRKPILMGALAIMLALTGLQLGKAFMGGTPDQGVVSDAAPAVSQTESEKTSALPKAGELEMQKSADPVAAPSLAPLAPTNDESKVRVVEPVAETASAAKAMMTDKVTEAPQAEAVANQTDTATLAPQTAPANPSDASSEAIPADTGPIALREAAASGDAKALFEIGSRYADGRGVEKDPKKAVEWYQKAADAGFAPAQFRLGSLYEKGIGVERTPAKAKMLYQLAAEQGNASAMHNLAVLFAMGAAGPTDNDSAARWFVKAAELGVKDSQYNLGILAAKGLGVTQSLEESYKWFALAAKSGDKDAATKRDEIANVMRPEQLQKARAATELWKAKIPTAESNSVEVPEAWNSDKGATASTTPVEMTKAIRNIQIILNQNGYDAGSPDGKMGGKTKKAIAAYQKANKMPATGEVDEALVKSLLNKVKS